MAPRSPGGADGEYREEVIALARDGPLRPGEDWLALLPPLIAGTIILDFYGLRFGAARADHLIDVARRYNRTDWFRPSEGINKEWLGGLPAHSPVTIAEHMEALPEQLRLAPPGRRPQRRRQSRACSFPERTSGTRKTTGSSARSPVSRRSPGIINCQSASVIAGRRSGGRPRDNAEINTRSRFPALRPPLRCAGFWRPNLAPAPTMCRPPEERPLNVRPRPPPRLKPRDAARALISRRRQTLPSTPPLTHPLPPAHADSPLLRRARRPVQPDGQQRAPERRVALRKPL